jgi:hypothetical protein
MVLLALALLGHAADTARAAVVVLANRSQDDVRFRVSSAAGPSPPCTLAKGDVMAIPMMRGVELAFSTPRLGHKAPRTTHPVTHFQRISKNHSASAALSWHYE